ncbi:50S ribosomal protein L31 [compost metagenome]
MKQGIHPKYNEITASCVCGNVFKTGSTKGDIRTEICANCHPFFTGTQKIVDTEGRVDRFLKKFETSNQMKTRNAGKAPAAAPAAPAPEAAPAEQQG